MSGFLQDLQSFHYVNTYHLNWAYLFELFGQNGVQEGIATAVQRQNENRKDFGLFQINQINSSCGS